MSIARILVAMLFATFSASATAHPLAGFELRGSEVAPLERPEVEKSYYVGGAMSLSGTMAWAIDNASGQGGFGIERLDNDASFGTSGPLMLALFVTTSPIVPGQTFSYWVVVREYTPGLAYNFYRYDIIETGPLEGVPNGTYYLHVGVFEQEAGCTSSSGYCLDDVFTFNDRLTVSNGVWSVAGPTPPPGPTPPSGATTQMVEYYHTVFGHYFATADAGEIAGLDAGAFGGVFTRTGQTWKVYTSGTGIYDVCRLFTTPGTFGTKSSHFYTADAGECNGLKLNPNWIYEKIAAKVALPVNGVCPAGTTKLYRLYNNGQTGAPNHRYTTSTTTRGQMIAQGFVPEDANSACVPL